MAHKKGLDGTYLQPTLEECYKEFFKAISDLTIDDNERLRIQNNVLEKENDELEKQSKTIDLLKKMQVNDRERLVAMDGALQFMQRKYMIEPTRKKSREGSKE